MTAFDHYLGNIVDGGGVQGSWIFVRQSLLVSKRRRRRGRCKSGVVSGRAKRSFPVTIQLQKPRLFAVSIAIPAQRDQSYDVIPLSIAIHSNNLNKILNFNTNSFSQLSDKDKIYILLCIASERLNQPKGVYVYVPSPSGHSEKNEVTGYMFGIHNRICMR